MNNQNKLRPEHLGIHSINYSIMHDSASRAIMMGGHFATHLVVEGMTPKPVLTETDYELSKYTISSKMPEDGRIIKIIPRYPEGVDRDSLPFNPETIIIYEKESNNQIDFFVLPYYHSVDNFFGYRGKHTPDISKLKQGANIAKNTVFSDTPAVADDGAYMFGVALNAAFMTVPSVSEDGVIISEDKLDLFKFPVYETRSIEMGSNCFPLNLYGTPTEYKPFPEIGDYIRDDGILMMTREYDNEMTPVSMSVYDCMEPDFTFDQATYARGPGGRIVDVRVISNNSTNRKLPEQMTDQLERYKRALLRFHREIIETDAKLRKEHFRKYGDYNINVSPRMHRQLVESLAYTNAESDKMKQQLILNHRMSPLDEYRVEITVEYMITPKKGFKFTDLHGGKGVLCKIEKPENMPVDIHGVRADIIFCTIATINRMNIGRTYEQYFGNTTYHIARNVTSSLGFSKGQEAVPEQIMGLDENIVNSVYDRLLSFYKIISKVMYDEFSVLSYNDKCVHLSEIINDFGKYVNGLFVYVPINNHDTLYNITKELAKEFPVPRGPVTYRGDSGRMVKTTKDVRIGPMYIMALNKIADEWSSVASARLQHFGILAVSSKAERNRTPYRNNPVRFIGETEARIFAGYLGREAIAEMIDRSNNPQTQRMLYRTILESKTPSNIDKLIDREVIPYGGAKPLLLIKHMMNAAGFKIVYEPESK